MLRANATNHKAVLVYCRQLLRSWAAVVQGNPRTRTAGRTPSKGWNGFVTTTSNLSNARRQPPRRKTLNLEQLV